MVAEREMVRRKETRFEGWGCSVCGWVHPYPRINAEDIEPRENIEARFHLHRCEKYPPPEGIENANSPDVSYAASFCSVN